MGVASLRRGERSRGVPRRPGRRRTGRERVCLAKDMARKEEWRRHWSAPASWPTWRVRPHSSAVGMLRLLVPSSSSSADPPQVEWEESSAQVPPLLEQCVAFLRQASTSTSPSDPPFTDGLFRVAGHAPLVSHVRGMLEAGRPLLWPPWAPPKGREHVVATVLKDWLTSLRTPLIPPPYAQPLLLLTRTRTPEGRLTRAALAEMRLVLARLPPGRSMVLLHPHPPV